MSTLTKIAVTLVVVPLLFYVLPAMFEFFGIGSNVYFIYVIWFIALMILNAVLPSRIPNMFSSASID